MFWCQFTCSRCKYVAFFSFCPYMFFEWFFQVILNTLIPLVGKILLSSIREVKYYWAPNGSYFDCHFQIRLFYISTKFKIFTSWAVFSVFFANNIRSQMTVKSECRTTSKVVCLLPLKPSLLPKTTANTWLKHHIAAAHSQTSKLLEIATH